MYFSNAWVYIKIFARWTTKALFAASLCRLVVWIGFYFQSAPPSLDLLKAFIVGVRFDLVVFGFFWLFYLALVWGLTVTKRTSGLFNLSRLYWVMVSTFCFLYAFSEIFFVAARGYRINSEFSQVRPEQIFIPAWQAQSALFLALLVASQALIAIWSFRHLLKIEEVAKVPQLQISKTAVIFRVFLTFLIAGLAARGDVRSHHLRYEDALVSENPWINQIPLNPIWSHDKDIVFPR